MRIAGGCIALAVGVFLMVFFGMQHLWRENSNQAQQARKYKAIVEKQRLRIQDLEREIAQLRNTIEQNQLTEAEVLENSATTDTPTPQPPPPSSMPQLPKFPQMQENYRPENNKVNLLSFPLENRLGGELKKKWREMLGEEGRKRLMAWEETVKSFEQATSNEELERLAKSLIIQFAEGPVPDSRDYVSLLGESDMEELNNKIDKRVQAITNLDNIDSPAITERHREAFRRAFNDEQTMDVLYDSMRQREAMIMVTSKRLRQLNL